MKTAYGEERLPFLAFFLVYHCGNWLLELVGLGTPSWIAVVHRSAICIALAGALMARSRRWDWVAVGVVAAAYVLRRFTQIIH